MRGRLFPKERGIMMNPHELLKELAAFSEGGPGTTRLTYSPEYRQAREVILREMKGLGMTISEDSMGNLFGRLPGKDESKLPVGIGSHIDTVPQGGDYDGMVGVVAALSVVEQIQDEGGSEYPLEVIVFAAEESSRFGIATMGSQAMAGKGDFAKWLEMKDKKGISFREALLENGLSPERLSDTARKPGEWAAFFELHIEQGPVLERSGLDIGVVEAIAGPIRMKIRALGQADHSGATPMKGRKDALVASSYLIQAVEEAGQKEGSHGTVATVGNVIVTPGVMNVIPGEVELWVDLRGINKESIQRAFDEIQERIQAVSKAREIDVQVEIISTANPVALDTGLIGLLSASAEAEGVSHQVMPSGAGHDAMYMAELAPTGMLFIPCKGGISHNPAEYSTPEQIDIGIRVLKRAVSRFINSEA